MAAALLHRSSPILASISPPKAENVAKALETDGTIKGNGTVFVKFYNVI